MCTRMEIHNTQLTVFFKCQKIVQNSHKLSEIHGCIYALYIRLWPKSERHKAVKSAINNNRAKNNVKFSQSVENNKCPNSSIYSIYRKTHTHTQLLSVFCSIYTYTIILAVQQFFFWAQHLFAFNHPLFYDNIFVCVLYTRVSHFSVHHVTFIH